MADEDRIRRPSLGRTQPIRSWSAALKSAPAVDQPSSIPRTPADGAPDDGVARSVEMGYRVVDEYMRRGRETAERMRTNPLDASALFQDARDVAERIVRGVSDAIGAWAELLDLGSTNRTPSSFSNGRQANQPRTAGTDGAATDAHGPDAQSSTACMPVRVRVSVDAGRRVDVVFDVGRTLENREPVIHSLRDAKGDAARLDGVTCTVDADGMPVITVRVDAGTPAGTYGGPVVDGRSAELLGMLNVVVCDG